VHSFETRFVDPVVQFVGSPQCTCTCPTIGCHLRHERQAADRTPAVERLQDLIETSNFGQISGAESKVTRRRAGAFVGSSRQAHPGAPALELAPAQRS
jgi:hypothetical protein